MGDTAELIARLRDAAGLKRDCNVCDGNGIKESGRPCGGCNQTGSVLVYGGRVGEMMTEAADALSSLVRERDELRHDNEMLTKGGIIEVAIRNFSVADYMNHWEGRAETAEAQVDGLTRERDEARQSWREAVDMYELEAARVDPAIKAFIAAEARATAAEAERDSWRRVSERLEGEKIAAEADAARMREALKPFAVEANKWSDMWEDDYVPVLTPAVIDDGDNEKAAFTVGDLRRALLRSIEGGERG